MATEEDIATEKTPNKYKKITSKEFVNKKQMDKRQAVRLQNLEKETNAKREGLSGAIIWFDSKKMDQPTPDDSIFSRIIQLNYTGVITYLENIDTLFRAIPERMIVILKLRNEEEYNTFLTSEWYQIFQNNQQQRLVLSYNQISPLQELKNNHFTICYHCYVDDNQSLHSAIYDGVNAHYLSILFRDPTNIPLELVIASLQKTETILIKEINDATDIDDAIVTLGVMEFGAEGVSFSPQDHDILSQFIEQVREREQPTIALQIGTIKGTKPIGMGYRACIDTVTLFDDDEGILVGSTSQGGILCCAEVFFLPYMELRPFRVNAGAVHSYVYNTEDRTDYMSELKAGSQVMLVNAQGRIRTSAVGRVKIEQRPLRLIEVVFSGGETVNIILQDDWHVRIFSDRAEPLNISELKPGDKVLGYVTEVGRHVGIKIDENILEK